MSMQSEAGADIRVFRIVHDTLRSFADRLARTAEALQPGDSKPLSIVTDRWVFYARQLHHHHAGEDDLLFPRLRRARQDFANLDEQLRREHGELGVEMSAVDDALTTASREIDEQHLASLRTALASFKRSLNHHLDVEDETLLPLVHETIPHDEYAAMDERMLKSTSRRDLPIVVAALEERVHALPPTDPSAATTTANPGIQRTLLAPQVPPLHSAIAHITTTGQPC
jgi:hemerythrin-like domain-containing protein